MSRPGTARPAIAPHLPEIIRRMEAGESRLSIAADLGISINRLHGHLSRAAGRGVKIPKPPKFNTTLMVFEERETF